MYSALSTSFIPPFFLYLILQCNPSYVCTKGYIYSLAIVFYTDPSMPVEQNSLAVDVKL
jgi:hypothetical protein